jgi:predicted RND superfamily exporter protein
LHCWVSGIPFDFWTQYETVFPVLIELAAYSTAAGFGIAFIFLLGTFTYEKHHAMGNIVGGSLIGAMLIAATIILSLVAVTGLGILVGVNLTDFSIMSFVLSVGFAVEYSVHIVSRWMRADLSHSTSSDRVEHAMSFLMLPTFMSFVSSTIGVACLAFTEFEFNRVFFFKPLIIVMFVCYWYGCWFLPVLLSYMDFDMVKLGKPAPTDQPNKELKEEAQPNVSPTASERDEELPSQDTLQHIEQEKLQVMQQIEQENLHALQQIEQEKLQREGYVRLTV